MDVNILRSLVTLLSFVGFVGLVAWAYSPRRKRQFEEVGAMLLVDSESVVDLTKHQVQARSGANR